MPGKVFISCGQRDVEKDIALQIKEILKSKNFDPYVAIESQGIQDINYTIIEQLKMADYYVFIDFAREKIFRDQSFDAIWRGSLFSHQELALAYFLDFKYVLFLKNKNVELEGFAKHLMSNARTFSNLSEVLPLFIDELSKRAWSPHYSRHLIVCDLKMAANGKPVDYPDHTGQHLEFIYHLCVKNNRTYSAAFNTVVKLKKIRFPDGCFYDPADRSFLKWAGKANGYSTIILPQDFATIDLLAIDQKTHCIRLHSEEDIYERRYILKTPGDYLLQYQIFAQNFPMLDFSVNVRLTDNISTTKIELITENSN